MTELEELRQAAKEVIWAANRDPEEGPTGWAQALSKLARLAFQMDETVPMLPDAASILSLVPACPHCQAVLEEGVFNIATELAETCPEFTGVIVCPACGIQSTLEDFLHV